MAKAAKKIAIYPKEKLEKSPIHGITPITEREVDISLLDTDPTNPGSDEFSKRYTRRRDSIRESFHIIGGPVYPLVVCESPYTNGRYLLVDGHGRGDEARRSQKKKVRVIIYPPLTLEQRICLREVLNAAQEPFDPPLVLKDLQLLANERGLSIRNSNDLVVNAIREQHPKVAREFAGDKLYLQVLELYFQKLFRGGRRSQETTREAAKMLKNIPQDDPLVKRFLKGKVDFTEFQTQATRKIAVSSEKEDLVPLCKELNSLLTDIDVNNLTAVERRSLKRTAEQLSQVLAEMGVA
jgi:hypothetical protein